MRAFYPLMVSTDLPARRFLKLTYLTEFLKFGVVGASGVAVNAGVFLLIVKLTSYPDSQVLFGLWPTAKNFRVYHLAATISFILANVWNFELNRAWTFRPGGMSSRKRFGRYFVIGVAAFVCGLWIMSMLLTPGSPVALPLEIFDGSTALRKASFWANLIQIFATMPISFVLQKVWTFSSHDEEAPAEVVPEPAKVP
ncbi:hypothetical protein AUCHE_03_01140 [Austwickia chelonae NBRC 105200]|uniref:GtrA/DPMS transmembrane domain-containing protein n=1 Tax=Austwickia chelonae NBRC 105200 TaxID=1184607 RepID=K6W4Z4_9MICO|nr:hypothetical protein AUCHE_03_01140 [Austwickia chelonae NBRC 105200]